MLDEVDRALHDALCVVRRVLESSSVVPGGGAVVAALTICLDNFANALGSKEQLAINEFAEALLVIPKTLAVNAAKDATDLVAKLCALHNVAQKSEDKKYLSTVRAFLIIAAFFLEVDGLELQMHGVRLAAPHSALGHFSALDHVHGPFGLKACLVFHV